MASNGGGSAAHTPVLLCEALAHLDTGRGGLFVDCTLGFGGHAEAVLERSSEARVLGIDRDPEALAAAEIRLERFEERFAVFRGSFADIRSAVEEHGMEPPAGILADLGVSSMQLDRARRGFSFRQDGPLDMRMDPAAAPTAADIVNGYSEKALEDVLKEYGEERRARRIAKAIVERRDSAPIETTGSLRDVVHRAIGSRSGKVDSATRTFQAIRIEVNQELAQVGQLIDEALNLLETDGRLVVISYHSLEDRIVKSAFRDAALGEVDPVTGRARSETRLIELLTRKPLRPGEEEVRLNPRARSARLRAARRI